MKNNRIPNNVQTIHLIAVGGTAMGAMACMLQEMGYTVTGSDHKVYPPMSHFLARRGIRILEGFQARNLASGPDLVIVGNAVSKDNPEVVQMLQMELPFCSMPQAVNRFAVGQKNALLVTGTHGKTTTSALLAWLLYEAGRDPSFMIGGLLQNFASNYRLGSGDEIVIEGDEYDTAFFDKGPKFMHYDPMTAILTSVEFDHADIFKDLAHVKSVFGRFVAGLDPRCVLVAYDNDANLATLVASCRCRLQLYGRDGRSPWRLGKIAIVPPWTRFEVFKAGELFGTFETRLMGTHNLLNALAAIAAADGRGVTAATIARALKSFQGVQRRQEIRGVKNGITVMDDFAHHPTAVRETIQAVKPFFPDGRMIAVFEPRTNSSMRQVFQPVYPLVFDEADVICIRKPPLLSKIPVHERFSSEKLVADLKQRNKEAHFFEDTEGIIAFLTESARAGDVILIMSNGGFDNIHARLLENL
jgi:UDP-N-acetylmuramate: L-alanyl-gamma-D-glutamyl-meso-diaminopimelate ligase